MFIKFDMVMVLVNLVLMLISVGVLIRLIVRTEKGLDKAFKLLIIGPLVLALTSLLQIDNLIGVLPREYAKIVFYGSRFIANASFLAACLVLLNTVSRCQRREK